MRQLTAGLVGLGLVAFALARLAWAVDFTTVLLDLDNHPITLERDGTSEPMTLGKVSANALLITSQDEQALDGAEKVRRFQLALKVKDATDLALSAEEVTLLKKLIARAYGPIIVGRAWALLDPASVPAR